MSKLPTGLAVSVEVAMLLGSLKGGSAQQSVRARRNAFAADVLLSSMFMGTDCVGATVVTKDASLQLWKIRCSRVPHLPSRPRTSCTFAGEISW